MRLSRVAAESPGIGPELLALVSAGQLDLLQLDYATAPQAYSATFFDQFRTLHKHFFLDPGLRLITNAGGGAVTPCIEALGEYLREHGDAGMLITAVRGDNLLPRLADLAADGIELVDESTGQPLLEIKLPLLAAQVELGAGPFVSAWKEDARIVVAGGYDATAPFVAAVNAELSDGWNNYDALARIAVAFHAASLSSTIAEVLSVEQVSLAPWKSSMLDPGSLERQLKARAAHGHLLRCADVHCDLHSITFQRDAFDRLRIEGSAGRKPPESWRVRLTYAAGDVVDSHQQAQVRWTSIPRDAVNVSVDTRPASDWF